MVTYKLELSRVGQKMCFGIVCITSHVAQATSHSYGARKNSTLRNFVLPLQIISKLGMIDYVGDPHWYANFSCIWLCGEFPTNRWNISSLWLFVVSLFHAHAWSKNLWTDLHDRRLKTCEIRQGYAFLGVSSKKFHPQYYPPNSANFALWKQFSH